MTSVLFAVEFCDLQMLYKHMKAIELDNRESEEEKNEAYIQMLMDVPEENFNKYHERD